MLSIALLLLLEGIELVSKAIVILGQLVKEFLKLVDLLFLRCYLTFKSLNILVDQFGLFTREFSTYYHTIYIIKSN